MKRVLLVCAVVLAAGGCGGETTAVVVPPPKPTVTGSWLGIALGTQATTLTLLESNGVVNGTGTIAGTPTGTRALSVTGILTDVNFSLTLSSGTLQPIQYQGNMNVNGKPMELFGTFTGSGFNGEVVILKKQ